MDGKLWDLPDLFAFACLFLLGLAFSTLSHLMCDHQHRQEICDH